MSDEFRPLAGLKVLSFEGAVSLPAATRMMAELGAEVVRVSRPGANARPTQPHMYDTTLSKASITLNLKTPEGIEVARRLVSVADVVCNNFTPRVMASYGLGYDDLRAIKPEIIALGLSGYGTPGPWAQYGAFGPSIEAAAGLNSILGEPSDPALKVGSDTFADVLAGRYALLAVIGALHRRRTTGEGQYIDLSMYEAIVHTLGVYVMWASARQRKPVPRGNRDPRNAPQGIYPASGEDEWVAISVRNDAEWDALRRLIADPSLDEASLQSLAGRQAAHDRIDEAIQRWTATRDKHEVSRLLQAQRIPAGAVQRASEVVHDQQLKHRGSYRMVHHGREVVGYCSHPHLVSPWMAVGRPRTAPHDPSMSSSDEQVLADWLGMSADDICALRESGAIADSSPPEFGAGRRVFGDEDRVPIQADFGERLQLPSPPCDGK